MHDSDHHPTETDPAVQPDEADPAVQLARLRRRAEHLVTAFAALVAVALGVGIAATETSNVTAATVLLAASAAAVAAMTVLTVVLLRLAARVRGIHHHARNPPR